MASRRLLPALFPSTHSRLLRTGLNAWKTTDAPHRRNFREYSTDQCYEQGVLSLACVKKLLANSNIQLFDVRSADEIRETGKIPQTTNIPLDEVEAAFKLTNAEFERKYKIAKPGKGDDNITFHCRSGVRAQKAIEIIQELGYKRAHNFSGGWIEWQKTMDADN